MNKDNEFDADPPLFFSNDLEDDLDLMSLIGTLQNEECYADESGEPEFKAGMFNTNQSVEQIVDAIQHVDEDGILDAVRVLIKLGADPIKLLLNPTIPLDADNSHQIIARALAQVGIEAVGRLVKILKENKNSFERATAALTLGYIKDKRAVEPLVAAVLYDKDWWVQNAAARALGLVGDKRAVDPILEIVKRDHRRLDAIMALGELRDERAVETLIEILQKVEETEFIKYAEKTKTALYMMDAMDRNRAAIYAAEALGKIGSKKALRGLILLQNQIEQELYLVVLKEGITKAIEQIELANKL